MYGLCALPTADESRHTFKPGAEELLRRGLLGRAAIQRYIEDRDNI